MCINHAEAKRILDLNTYFCILIKNKRDNDINKNFIRVKPRLI